MPYRALVSSTFVDLKDHRARAIRQLRQSGFDVSTMEDWTADADEPRRFSLERMRDCDLCLLLVAFRRGFVPEGQDLSITQLEYRHARAHGIEVLPFLLDDTTSDWPCQFDERAADPALRPWREEVRRLHGVETFGADPASLDVAPALNRWRHRHQRRDGLLRYLASVRSAHGSIRFLGLPQLKDNQDVRIDRLFVDPFLSAQDIPTDQVPERWPPTSPLFEAVAETPRLVVLGHPGSGKSTLVDWLAHQLAAERANECKTRLGNLLPVPLILRDLGIGAGVTFDSLIETFLALPLGRPLAKDHLLQLIEDGDALILLDGLDEIGSVPVRRDLRDAVHEGMERFPRCRFLLTSRLIGYEHVPFHLEPRAILHGDRPQDVAWSAIHLAEVRHVAPFNDAQIEQFATRWYEAREADPIRSREGARDLIEAVHRDPATTRLARIPNLLTIMALIHRIRAWLPNGKALLYNEIAEAYLHSIDGYRKLREDNDLPAEKRRWLGRVGFEMQLQREAASKQDHDAGRREVLVEAGPLQGWVADAMRASGRKVDEDEPARFLDRIKRRSGLLIERGADQFAFTHLSFQEYFAACYLREKIASPRWMLRQNMAPGTEPEALQAYARSDVWRETLVFLFELIAAEAPDWLETLAACLFGPDWVATPTGDEPQETICLLARLAVNRHAFPDEPLRDAAMRRCWSWEVIQQKRDRPKSWESRIVAAILLATDASEQTHALNMLADLVSREGLKTLGLAGTGVSDLGPLARLVGLQRLYLGGTSVRDLAPLAGLTGLQSLSLAGTGVRDVTPLAGLADLRVLSLDNTRVSDLIPLARLTDLQVLSLADTAVRDLAPLVGLVGLQSLSLGGTGVSDLTPLAGLTGLQSLSLADTAVSDLGPLARLADLQWLALDSTAVSDLAPLAGLTNLQRLSLADTAVSDLGPLAGLMSLQSLSLNDTEVSDLAPLAGLADLQRLYLGGTSVRSHQVDWFRASPRPELTIYYAPFSEPATRRSTEELFLSDPPP